MLTREEAARRMATLTASERTFIECLGRDHSAGSALLIAFPDYSQHRQRAARDVIAYKLGRYSLQGMAYLAGLAVGDGGDLG